MPAVQKARVLGSFDVRLSMPIFVAPSASVEGLDDLKARIKDSEVVIRPLYIHSGHDGKELTDLRVWIVRRATIEESADGAPRISKQEEQSYEEILVEAVGRLVTLAKEKSEQWALNNRYPVAAYSFQYSYEDATVATRWPLEPHMRRVPRYRRALFSSVGLVNEITPAEWSEMGASLGEPRSIPLHKELVLSAKAFLAEARPDAALLFAAMAAESILEAICARLLARKGLTEDQCEQIQANLRVPGTCALIRKLDDTLRVGWDRVDWLFKQRNRLAHGRRVDFGLTVSADAIRTVEELERVLESLQEAPRSEAG